MEAARTDLVLLVILGAGTDYTPGLPLTQMSSLWQHYIALRRTDPRFLTRSVCAACPVSAHMAGHASCMCSVPSIRLVEAGCP